MNRIIVSIATIICLSLNWTIGQQTVGLITHSTEANLGYNLFSTTSDVVYLIDNCGRKINSWEVSETGYGPAYLLDDGDLLKLSRISNTPFNAGGGAGKLEKYSWEGDLDWSMEYSSFEYLSHHDIYPMANGNILMLAWEVIGTSELENLGRLAFPDDGIWTETIIEIKPIGIDNYEIIWKWNALDHTIQDHNSSLTNFGSIEENPQLLDINSGPLNTKDWLHFNSIDYDPILDQIMLSSRAMNEIYIIDHSTTTEEAAGHSGGNSNKGGDFLFRWGNPENYLATGNDTQRLFGQHNARWIKEDPESLGNILIFNNGAGIPSGQFFSEIVEIKPELVDYNYSLENGKFLPENAEWTFTENPSAAFYASRISSAQRLANGNTLINEGTEGRFFEVKKDGNKVWEYINPVNNLGPISQGEIPGNNDVFKLTRYEKEDPVFSNLNLEIGSPIELNPIVTACQTSSNTNIEDIRISYNNPVRDFLYLQGSLQIALPYFIINANGTVIEKGVLQDDYLSIDFSQKASGIYFLKINGHFHKLIKI